MLSWSGQTRTKETTLYDGGHMVFCQRTLKEEIYRIQVKVEVEVEEGELKKFKASHLRYILCKEGFKPT